MAIKQKILIVDDDNNIWMSTNGGISKLSTEKNVFENFTITDGLQSNEFNGRACFKSEDGYMHLNITILISFF